MAAVTGASLAACAGIALDEQPAQDLSRRGLGDAVDELDLTHPLVAGHAPGHPRHQLLRRCRRPQHDKGLGYLPAELEAVLLTHPAVADAAVVRKHDALAGEVPKAFVVLTAPASAQELMAWVAERVAGYKRVRHVEFTDCIPRSPAGKILRRLLVERDATPASQVGSGDSGHGN